MFIPIKWYSKYLRNNEIMSNFSRDMTTVMLCRQSFILQLQCMLCFRVCSIVRLILCAVNINESIVSIISSGSRHGKLTIYDSTTEQQTVLVQNFKYMLTCRRHDRNFLLICRHEKKILTSVLELLLLDGNSAVFDRKSLEYSQVSLWSFCFGGLRVFAIGWVTEIIQKNFQNGLILLKSEEFA